MHVYSEVKVSGEGFLICQVPKGRSQSDKVMGVVVQACFFHRSFFLASCCQFFAFIWIRVLRCRPNGSTECMRLCGAKGREMQRRAHVCVFRLKRGIYR